MLLLSDPKSMTFSSSVEPYASLHHHYGSSNSFSRPCQTCTRCETNNENAQFAKSLLQNVLMLNKEMTVKLKIHQLLHDTDFNWKVLLCLGLFGKTEKLASNMNNCLDVGSFCLSGLASTILTALLLYFTIYTHTHYVHFLYQTKCSRGH